MILSGLVTFVVLSIVDALVWVIFRGHLSRLRLLSLPERVLFLAGGTLLAGVLVLIALGVLGPWGIPAAMSAIVLGFELAVAIELRSLWATSLWRRAANASIRRRR